MDGLFINVETPAGIVSRRPKSKKEVRETLAAHPERIAVENTSMFGGYRGMLVDAPGPVDFVGPNPYTDRRFYGRLSKGKDGRWKLT